MSSSARYMRKADPSSGDGTLSGIMASMGAGQGDRIRARRLALGMSVADMAKAVGVSRMAAHVWETADNVEIKHAHLKKLARVLRCSEGHITDGGPVEEHERSSSPLDMELLTDVLVGLEKGLEGRELPPEKKAQIIAALYEMFSDSQAKPERAKILAFVKRAV